MMGDFTDQDLFRGGFPGCPLVMMPAASFRALLGRSLCLHHVAEAHSAAPRVFRTTFGINIALRKSTGGADIDNLVLVRREPLLTFVDIFP
jgi:hypothetical protein